jgi:hypothetical protein
MEAARSAAGQRKARKFRKHKQLSFFVACLAVFAYVPFVWHSEPSILILNLRMLISLLNEVVVMCDLTTELIFGC